MSINTESGTSLPEASVEAIGCLRAVLAAVPQGLGLGPLGALLAVAVEAGLSVNDLAERIGAPQQTASRYVAQLMGRYQESAEPPVPLLEQRVSVDDPRRRALFLTSDGLAAVETLVAAGRRP